MEAHCFPAMTHGLHSSGRADDVMIHDDHISGYVLEWGLIPFCINTFPDSLGSGFLLMTLGPRPTFPSTSQVLRDYFANLA